MSTQIDINPAKDSFLDSAAATTNYGAQQYSYHQANPAMRAILEFSLSTVPAGKSISAATLYMYVFTTATYSAGQSVAACKCTRTDWVEGEVTWNIYKTGSNWSSAGGDFVTTNPACGTANNVGSTNWWTCDVLAIVQDAYATGITADFIVKYVTESGFQNQQQVRSKEYTTAAYRPILRITYADTVTTQAPSSVEKETCTGNGNIVSIPGSTPTVRGFCWNTTGNATVADSHTTENGTFSTGAFTASVTGLSAGTKYYIRSYCTSADGTQYGTDVTFVTKSAVAWYNTAWLYRKQLLHFGSADGALTYYPRRFVIYRSSGTDSGQSVYVGTNCKTDYSDIRFTKADGSTLLDYYIEASDSSSAAVWVEFDSIANGAAVDTLFFMYYGNANATAVSSGANTFSFFDDFAGTTIDTGKWAVTDTGSNITQNNKLIIANGTPAWTTTGMKSVATFNRSDALAVQLKYKSMCQRGTTYKDTTMVAITDPDAGVNYTGLIYGLYFIESGGTKTQDMFEDGNDRTPLVTTWVAETQYYVRQRVKTGGGCITERSTDGVTWTTIYDSSYSTEATFKVGFTHYQGGDVYIEQFFVFKKTANDPVVDVWGAEEVGTTTYTKDFTADLEIQTSFTKTLTADTLIKALNLVKTIPADVLIQKLDLTVATPADVLIQALSLTKTIPADVLIQKTGVTKTFLARVIIGTAFRQEISADVIFLKIGVVSITSDVLIRKSLTVTVTADTLIRLSTVISVTADVIIGKSGLTLAITADMIISHSFAGNFVNFYFIPGTEITADMILVRKNIDLTLPVDLNIAPPFWDIELPVSLSLKMLDVETSFMADVLLAKQNIAIGLPVDLNLYQPLTIDEELLAAQQSRSYKPAVKVTFTKAGSPTYTHTWGKNILKLAEHIDPFKHNATIILHNAKKTLTNIDFEGYQCVISWGIYVNGTPIYVDSPPMKVFPQTHLSTGGLLAVTLECKGIISMMEDERASCEENEPARTVKQWIENICSTQSAAYGHCIPYGMVWHNLDPTLDFVPGSQFKININEQRSDALRYLLDRCNIVMRPENDGRLHFFTPQTSGDYDFEYELKGDHTFFSKENIKNAVLPNYIVVSGKSPASGLAQDAQSVGLHGEWRYYENITGLTTNDQCQAVATALLNKIKSNAKTASVNIPMDCFRRIYDWVNVIDSREGSTRDGNIGYINRYWNDEGYRMDIGYGGWLDYIKQQQFLKVTGGGGGGGYSIKFPEIPDTLSVSLPDTNLDESEVIYMGQIYVGDLTNLYLHSINIFCAEGRAALSIQAKSGGNWVTCIGFPVYSNFSYKWEYPLGINLSGVGQDIRFVVYNPSAYEKARYVNASVNYDIRNLYHEL